MASFDTNGLDALIIDLDEISEIDDETMLDMLEAGGEVIRKAHVEAIKKIFGHRSGKFEESPTVHKKMIFAIFSFTRLACTTHTRRAGKLTPR